MNSMNNMNKITILLLLSLVSVVFADTLRSSHFWDCNGGACDARTLQPWDQNKYRYAGTYAPINPQLHGGPLYGEKLWMTGAASDTLSKLLGANDGCCGVADEGGCGKCLLVTNPSAVNKDWSAVVMKKNRCPPWSHGCENGNAHFDLAVPGYDNLEFSTANICGQPNTILSKYQSSVCGDWYKRGSSTIQGCSCGALPNSTNI